jgi:hypothetical protein
VLGVRLVRGDDGLDRRVEAELRPLGGLRTVEPRARLGPDLVDGDAGDQRTQPAVGVVGPGQLREGAAGRDDPALGRCASVGRRAEDQVRRAPQGDVIAELPGRGDGLARGLEPEHGAAR